MRCHPPCLLPCGARISGETPFSRLSGGMQDVPRLGLAIAGGCGAFAWGAAFGHDSLPRRRPGSRALDLCRLVFGVPSVGGDWPGLAPAGDLLSCGDKERRQRNAPCRSAGFAGALAPPASGGSRRNSPWRAQTSTRQFPPAAGCARRRRRGKPPPARLRHCRRRALPLSRARHPGAFCCLAGSVALLQCSPSPSLQCAVCFRPSIRWTPLTTASTRAPAMTPAAPLITTGASAPHRPPSCSESCSIQ